MLRTTVVGSWPMADEFEDQMKQYHQGQLTSQQAEILLGEVARVAIAQQQECGLDEYTGGETWADSFVLHFPTMLSGITPTTDRDAWGGRGSYESVGPLSAPQGLGIASAYRREKAIAPGISKVNIPGPSEITMMIVPRETRRTLWADAITLLRVEMAACVEAGVKEVQLDLPHIAMGLVDGDLALDAWCSEEAVDIIEQLLNDFEGIRRSIHFCYGDFGARTWTKNRSFHPLLPTIQRLDGVIDRVVLEFSLPEQWAERALLAEVPSTMEVAAGIVDVKSPKVEAHESLIARVQELLLYVPAERLLICPSCGLGRRNVELAMGKASQMVQSVTAIRGVS